MTELKPVPSGVKDKYSQHDPEARREFMLAVLRATQSRAKTMVLDIEEIGVSLRLGMISPEAAVTWAHQIGADYFMPTETNGGLITLDEVAA